MAQRKSLKEDSCPIARSLDAIGDRWSMLIVRDAFDGTRRFVDFQRNLGVARNILAERLRSLVEDDVLRLVPAAEGGARQEYTLTPKGEALFPVLVALRQWGEERLYEPGEQRSRLVDRESGHELTPVEIRTADGALLDPGRAVVRTA